ncbi:MAG: hypothetical protein BGO56_04885 [Sphingobacteriales bacterium 48-107]|nr:MAG: hypothetical protein BGO56_04885 [Sphingobacteriales bacterium 48-107]
MLSTFWAWAVAAKPIRRNKGRRCFIGFFYKTNTAGQKWPGASGFNISVSSAAKNTAAQIARTEKSVVRYSYHWFKE